MVAGSLGTSVGLFLAGFALDGFVDFFTMDRDISRGINPKPNFVTTNLNHHQCNGVTDNDLLIFFSAKYKHLKSPVNLSS